MSQPSSEQLAMAGQVGSAQWQILEHIARGGSLPELLVSIVSLVEQQAEGMLCTILSFDAETNQLRHGAAGRLAPELRACVDGLSVPPNMPSCGVAAFRRERVVVTDIATHSAWDRYKEPFLARGLRGCWSTPILSPTGELLGALAMYFAEPRGPSGEERTWADAATHLAAIALGRAQAERESQRQVRVLGERVTELTQLHQRLELHVSRMPLGYVVWDRQLTVKDWNGAAERIFGWAAADVVGKRSRELAIFSEAAMRGDPLGRDLVASASGDARGTHEHVHKGGARVVCEWLHAPLTDENDQVLGYLSMAHDVTERKRSEEERARLQAQLRQGQRIASLGTLAGGIAHDFNNILTAISGHTHLGLNDIEEERSPEESLLAIQEASTRAVELVRRILMFSRYQRPERKLCPIVPIVEEALRSLRGTLPSGVTLHGNLDAALGSMTYVDAGQIHQVLMNLGANAAHAIGETGSIQVLVDSIPGSDPELGGGAEGPFDRYVRITFSDSGSGIDDATLERIFEPFFTTKPTGHGTGLGLSMVHGIVKGHEGQIVVQSRPGKGSDFRVYLPEAPQNVGQPPESGSPVQPSKPAPVGARVMYVDDEEPLVVLATRWLGKLGYQVTGFSDSLEALDAFRARPFDFDAVISDISMPGLSGLELVREMMAIRKDIVVVMSSGYSSVEARERARALGAVDVVLKPQSMAEFGKILHRILSEQGSRGPAGPPT